MAVGDAGRLGSSFDEFSSKSLFRYFRESLVGYNNSKQLESLYTFESDVDIDWSICSIKNQGSLVTENVEELIHEYNCKEYLDELFSSKIDSLYAEFKIGIIF